MSTVRLDQLLFDQGLFASREQALRAVMAGMVEVDGRRVDKPGTAVPRAAQLTVASRRAFVSRAGGKLEQALQDFGIDPSDRVCIDVGASTGGFTDCLLRRGARRVYAVDVGYGQLDAGLRADPRVVAMERVNARHLKPGDLPEPCSLAVVDVSFISLLKIVPALLPLLAPGADLLTLVKPQFEAPREQVGKGGIVRDAGVREAVIAQRTAEIAALGCRLLGVVDSAVRGMEGNQEAVAHFRLEAAS
jgi:23S rRNA (cytidine1920-2'-O)/16S rRNA (cytidine1409-2'-O)-methyltransferase